MPRLQLPKCIDRLALVAARFPFQPRRKCIARVVAQRARKTYQASAAGGYQKLAMAASEALDDASADRHFTV
jgi:hypothetical protein